MNILGCGYGWLKPKRVLIKGEILMLDSIDRQLLFGIKFGLPEFLLRSRKRPRNITGMKFTDCRER